MAAQSAAPPAQARISIANEDQGGPQSPQVAAAEGPPPPDGLGLNAESMACGPWASASMQRRHRLRSSAEFGHVRQQGRTLAHPLLVLSYVRNDLEYSRFGFVVGGRLGKAATRNRIKRRMREAVRMRIQEREIARGWDIVLIARQPIVTASFQQVDEAIGLLLRRAALESEASS
jgi:ribonuclease P protein component